VTGDMAVFQRRLCGARAGCTVEPLGRTYIARGRAAVVGTEGAPPRAQRDQVSTVREGASLAQLAAT